MILSSVSNVAHLAVPRQGDISDPAREIPVSLARIIRWDVDPTEAFDRPRSPEEIMDELEKRVGPEGRKLFENLLRQVNKLQAQQRFEARAQTVDSGE